MKSMLAACLLAALAISCSVVAEEIPLGIPFKPDPPLAVDGDLGDWTRVPHPIALSDASQVVWGEGTWKSPQDLSGTVRLAWREECLFVAVDVIDDIFAQSQRGDAIWKGDHVELFLDAQPERESERGTFGDGQYQIGLSPGNFRRTGDSLLDCPPEAHFYRPEGLTTEGIVVASARTATGYTLEASIPWSTLGVAKPASGFSMRYEVAISDTDTVEPQQDTMMTTSSATWEFARARLTPATLAGTDGVATPPTPERVVFDEMRLKQGEKIVVSFTAPPTPADRDAVLTFRARLDFEQVAGYTPALRLRMNGQPIVGDRLINKPLRVRSHSGQTYSMAANDVLSVFYSPDFTSPDSHPYYGLEGGVSACAFNLKLNGLLREGENMLEIEHATPTEVQSALIVSKVGLAFRLPLPPPKPKAGPPTGPLKRIEPRAELDTSYSVKEIPDAVIEITVGDETFAVESQFSTPKPEWVRSSNSYFTLERRIEPKPEAVVVHDTLTNLTSQNLPLMHRHQTTLGTRRKGLWLAGLRQSAASGTTSARDNPTTFVTTSTRGLGLIALDDVSRIHVSNYAVADRAGLADNNLVLKPHATCTTEWAILPTEAPDYFDFLNAARRLVDANFTVDGGFAFLRAEPLTDAWTDQQLTDFIRLKDARYVCASNSYPLYEGHYTHGTAFQRVTHDNYKTAFERWRRLVPEAKPLVYFHCFLDVTDDGLTRFADARLLRPDGIQADYGKPYYRIYFPTSTNAYGTEIARNIDVIFDEIGSDGVYWDEHEYSRWMYHYGEPWDGCSGEIDPQSMTVTHLKSSVTLLTEAWRVALAKRILARGPLIGNSVPYTRAMAALKFPCFVETGSISNCTQAQLYSPIALGDHLTECNERDAYDVMLAALDYGCVYHWYNDMTVVPTHHHLTRYMFPITPIELHEGYIIGRERIVTKVSGRYGWGDASKHEAHIFDDAGREVEGFAAPEIVEDGKTYTDLRLAEGWSAAVVKK